MLRNFGDTLVENTPWRFFL